MISLHYNVKSCAAPLALELKDLNFEGLHSTGRCNTLLKDFKRGFEAETFSGTVVKESLHPLDLMIGNISKVGLLREETSDETDGVFDSALFPAVKGQAEIGFGAQGRVDFDVLDILRAIVVSDGTT